MNKKFLSAILFGALVASTGSFVSCADNDDKIDQLQDQNSELKAQLAQLKSELQAELKNAASAAAASAVEAKLSAIEGVTSDNIAATVAALKGNFDTQEARVIALETQIKALEGLKDVDASELIAVLNKAKENGTADMTGLSAMVDALDADVNTLVSALRSLVFQPEFYVDGIEAAEYTYLRYIALWEKGDKFATTTASSDEISHTIYLTAPEGAYDTTPTYKHKNLKMGIKDDFVWQYRHTGDLSDVKEEDTKLGTSSLLSCVGEGGSACDHDACTYKNVECGDAVAKKGTKDKYLYVGKNILNTVVFAKNPANAKVNTEDATLAIKNIMAMTRANEATIKVVDVDNAAQPGYAVVTYYVENPEKLITANHDEEYGVLNKVENTTIIKLQAGAAENTIVESDWAALYETSIQPVAIALNKNAQAGHSAEKDSEWKAPIKCVAYNELHKNPYEAADATERTAEIDYLSQGVNIAEHIELHFVKRDLEKATHKHDKTPAEVQHPHVSMSLAEAAYKFGFEYEFKLVPYIIDDNKTNNSAYAHLVDGKVAGGKTAAGVEYPGLDLKDAVIIPNTVEEDPNLVKGTPWNLIPKKAVENSTYQSYDGYEQGASSVDREPLVQVLVKKDGEVILDGYVSFIITRTVGNVLAPVFDLGSQAKSCDYLHYSMTWNQVSELLYEKTANKGLGMSKLEFEESYELVYYTDTKGDNIYKEDPTCEDKPCKYNHKVIAQFDVKIAEDGKTVESAEMIDYANTYANIFQEFDENGIATSTLHLSLDKYDQQYVYEKKNHEDTRYVMYVRKGSSAGLNHSTLHGILVPIKIALDEVKGAQYVALNKTFWYKDGVTPDVNGEIAGRENVNHPLDNTNTFEYKYATDQPETFKPESDAESDVLGFVRDINDAWMGKKLNFSGLNKDDKYVKESGKAANKPTYYFHPANRGYEFVSENNGKTYVLDIENVNIECAIWVKGDDPVVYEGINKHSHTIVADAAKAYAEDPMIIKNTEKDHQVNTAVKSIYTNTKLYCYEKGKKPAKYTEDDVIAEMNRLTGKIHYRYNEISKLALNTKSHTEANLKAKIGIFLPNECDMAYYINNDTIKTNDFDLYYYRPIDIDVNDGYVTDAVNNADYIQLAKCLEFSDWRDYKFVDPTKANPYENIWLLAFYGVHHITVDFANATTDMNNEGWNILAKANKDIVLSYVDYDKKSVIADLDPETAPLEKATHTVNLRASGFDKASKGVKSTYDYIQEHFGYIKYMNKGANLSNYHIKVPVTFGYDWGEITRVILIHVNGTEGNHTADAECHVK